MILSPWYLAYEGLPTPSWYFVSIREDSLEESICGPLLKTYAEGWETT
jgi:hypothetical protein